MPETLRVPAPEGAAACALGDLDAPLRVVSSWTDGCICGIDPGLSGAIAFFYPATPERIHVEDLPTVGGEIDVSSLHRMVRTHGPAFAVIEQVGPMPSDGAKQAFRFGGAYAAARAVLTLAHIPLHLVSPSVWKRHHRILAADDPKEASRALALRLMPASSDRFSRKADHGRSDAALIARFGAATFNG